MDERCRFCGAVAERHHAVYRSMGGTDDPRNLIPLCRWHHRDVHDKKLDLLPLLDNDEQGYAASLIGIERAHRLLAPSAYREFARGGKVPSPGLALLGPDDDVEKQAR